MTARRCLLLLGLLTLGGLVAGCALKPDHVTLYAEHSEAETSGGPRRTRTETNKAGVSATYDLHPSKP